MHPLKRYLRDVREPIGDFAKRVCASRQTLYRIISGGQAPKPALARRIVEATGGAVSFSTLYRFSGVEGEVQDFNKETKEPLLNPERIKLAVEVVLHQLTPEGDPGPPVEATDIAAEAVISTYAALSKITTRRGPDRLRQAVRPVIEEILRDYGERPPSCAALDKGAAMAAHLYYTSWKFDRKTPASPAGQS